ncbi:mandelate racemase/muconate lactonizing enzyme family protein [Kribbella sp. NPDC050820]|uniref:mandelate racemase/muconate lactonizing enzyme family protein n=1 Tax=Kribbella sp. NPDC050820 TaxID=3155408 RepID=UPI00340099F4
MTSIESARAYLIDLPVKTPRHDAIQSFVKQETILVELVTTDGLLGIGYSYTIGNGGSAVLAMLQEHLLPQLIGHDATEIEAIWRMLWASTLATTVGAITSLALAAVDTALWDLRCLRADEPLWIQAGGARPRVRLYDTEGGWLQLPVDELVRNAKASRDAGWRGIKIKVGKPSVAEDVARIAAVRDAIGDEIDLMVDANQAFSRSEAIRRAAAFGPYDLRWFEEPMRADDVVGHQMLRESTSIPVAVGESMYSVGQFGDYLARGAATIVQVDVARVGGITPWLKVAHAAEVANVEVCPHFLMELHVSLAAAVPNAPYVEHIPQLDLITSSRLRIEEGAAVAPNRPGLGIDWDLSMISSLASCAGSGVSREIREVDPVVQ